MTMLHLKTWPKNIYLYGDLEVTYENQTGRLGWSEESFAPNIKYIRADIVREREEAAFYNGQLSISERPQGKEGEL
jgi:hypothetical protein